MKIILSKLLEFIIVKLQAIRSKFIEVGTEDTPYSSLAPIDDGDENGHYSRALWWALKNRKKEDIKNIALTGSYGSGKSSILKTFQKNSKRKGLKFLNISLATFEEEKSEFDENGKKIKMDKTKLLRLIETSILEQIFYHEEDSKIPDSRFKKIKSYSKEKLFAFSFGYLLFLLAIINYFIPNFIFNVFKGVTFSDKVLAIIHYVGIIIIGLGIFFLLFKSIRVLSAITVNKLKIQNAEVGFGENLNKSVLNHHIDEILYFFSIRPYNVVIIEDLDRFRETEIFTKLREVNLLLNSSEKTKRKEIVFIYAVRDDMFTDKERTKFFDFIIPVIPVINSSNSVEILRKKRSRFKYRLSDPLIEDLSFFINDMRLLHNISNEFYLYSEKLNETLNHDKLFAIITYKNIYPNDFMKLSYNEGDLYKLFDSKVLFLKTLVNEIDNEIDQFKNQIKEYENLFIHNIRDFRLLYILRVIESLPGFISFKINNETIPFEKVIEDDHFEYIRTNKYTYNQVVFDSYYGRESERNQNLTKKFSEIEKAVNQSKTYKEREKEIKDAESGKIYTLKSKIQELEKQKLKARNSKLADLLKSPSLFELKLSEGLDRNLVTVLLRNGYIAEDYNDYISLFHEESITRSDFQFHISVKNEIRLAFDYKLYKIEKLIQKINPHDFQTEYVLNYDILSYLLSDLDNHSLLRESLFDKLADESKRSVEFIKGYYERGQNLERFLKFLCSKWANIWEFLESNSDFSEDLKKSLFKDIIEFGDVEAIIEISKRSSFINVILGDKFFLNIISNQTKLKRIIQELKVTLNQIDFENSPDEMLSFIYDGDHYQLNDQMVTSFIKRFGSFNQIEFDNANYSAINKSKTEKLIQYIETNIDSYIVSLYLKISTNVNEEEQYLIKLLNNKNIKNENKYNIISQVTTKIVSLETIDNPSLYSVLFINNRIESTWENLLHYYNDKNSKIGDVSTGKIPESIIQFVNVIQNASELSKVKIPKEVNSEDIYSDFWEDLIQTNSIDDQSYHLLTKSSPWWYEDLNFEQLSQSKIKSLVDNVCINPTAKSFNLLKSNSEGLNIYLLEKCKVDYFKILDELTFDSDDLELILKSSNLTDLEKQKILTICSEEVIKTNNNLDLLSSILLQDTSFVISDDLLSFIILTNQVSVNKRIRLFIRHSLRYDHTFITSFLINLGGDYVGITDPSSKTRIPKSDYNWQLLNSLVRKGYVSSFSDKDDDFKVNHKRK